MRRPTHHGGATSSRFYGVRWKGYRSRIQCCEWEEANDRGRLCRLDTGTVSLFWIRGRYAIYLICFTWHLGCLCYIRYKVFWGSYHSNHLRYSGAWMFKTVYSAWNLHELCIRFARWGDGSTVPSGGGPGIRPASRNGFRPGAATCPSFSSKVWAPRMTCCLKERYFRKFVTM